MTSRRPLISPRALRTGDQVAVLAASGPPVPEKLEQGLCALRTLGLRPRVFASARATGTYLAGDDALRAADLTTALVDPAIRAVFLACGGYGAQRTLELVDWNEVGTPAPRVVVGYSDVTALLEAVSTHLGWVSVFGPMPAEDDFAPGLGGFDAMARLLTDPDAVTALRFPAGRTVVPGRAEGITLGGTASLLASSVGTDSSHPARGGILLLEDVTESPYRLDRIFTQLRRSGFLDGVAGIICGAFSECGPDEAVEAVLHDRLGDLGVPVLAGADIGHGLPMQPFPIGAPATLDTRSLELRFTRPVLRTAA